VAHSRVDDEGGGNSNFSQLPHAYQALPHRTGLCDECLDVLALLESRLDYRERTIAVAMGEYYVTIRDATRAYLAYLLDGSL